MVPVGTRRKPNCLFEKSAKLSLNNYEGQRLHRNSVKSNTNKKNHQQQKHSVQVLAHIVVFGVVFSTAFI
jgi:hypothetical protein